MDEAGLSFDDLAAAQGGQLPEGVTPQDLQKVGEAAQGLNNEEFTAASEAIEKHAKAECDVDLGS